MKTIALANNQKRPNQLKRLYPIVSLVLGFLFIPTSRTLATEINQCEEIKVFDDAPVNIVILPYSHDPTLGAKGVEIGNMLAEIVQNEILYSIAKYQDVGVVRIYGDPKVCTPDYVFQQVSKSSNVDWQFARRYFPPPPDPIFNYSVESVALKILQSRPREEPDPRDKLKEFSSRSGIVVLYGSIYQENEKLYIQSFIRFRRRDDRTPMESLPLSRKDSSLKFLGHISAQGFGFAPRELTTQDIEIIDELFAKEQRIFNSAWNKGRHPQTIQPYEIAKSQSWRIVPRNSGDWARVSVYTPPANWAILTDGWLDAEKSADHDQLNKLLPELQFIEGLVGYLRCRIGSLEGIDLNIRQRSDKRKVNARNSGINAYDASLLAIQHFLTASPAEDSTSVPAAVGRQLEAFITFLKLGLDNPTALMDGARDFEVAARLMPYSASALNLDLVTRVLVSLQEGNNRVPLSEIKEESYRSILLDPTDNDVLQNELNFDAYYGQTPKHPISNQITTEKSPNAIASSR